MNPFLYETVALPRRTGWPHVLRVASIAALAWAGAAGAVDLNTASLDQLRSVRGIGPRTAQIILEERDRGGRYQSFADLSDRVRGIGRKRAQKLQSAGLTIDGGGLRVGSGPAGTREVKPATAAPPGASRAPAARRGHPGALRR